METYLNIQHSLIYLTSLEKKKNIFKYIYIYIEDSSHRKEQA